MDKTELDRRKKALLDHKNLMTWIDNMIYQKGLGAVCRSVTTIAGPRGKDRIVVRLLIDDQTKSKPAMTEVTAYLPEAIYEDNRFDFIDSWLPDSVKTKGNKDTRTLLRALRVIFSIIRTVGTVGTWGSALQLSTDKPVYVSCNDDGLLSYHN